MSRPRLALLNASHDPVDTTRNFRRELDADLVEFRVQDGEFPEQAPADGDAVFDADAESDPDASAFDADACDFDGVVVTGSRSSVYWDDDWIPRLVDYVAAAHDAGVPVLGVCFGHQVLAAALGGEVADMDHYEIGYREIRRVADDPLLEGLGDTFTAFTTHSDTVTELPPGATLIAENDCGVHGFRVEQSVGVQFHPEYDVEAARNLVEEKDLDPDRRAEVLAGINEENYAAACETKRLFENFTAGLSVRTAAD